MIHRNLLVAEILGYRPLLMELAVPDGVRGAPVLVWVHGGGWLGGSPFFRPSWLGEVDVVGAALDAGYAVASVQYRMSAEAVFPAQLDDVRAAVAWLRAHAAEYGADATRMGVWGESAGGHLAALTALTDPGIGAAVLWYAPSDLLTRRAHRHPDAPPDPSPETAPEARLIGGPVAANLERARAASPVAHVSATAPPMLLMHGDRDLTVPCEQTLQLADALRAAGHSPEVVLVPGADHCWQNADIPHVIKTTTAFFDAHL